MVSMKDIAKACGVSVATVSKALSGQPDIGEQTRELICNCLLYTSLLCVRGVHSPAMDFCARAGTGSVCVHE